MSRRHHPKSLKCAVLVFGKPCGKICAGHAGLMKHFRLKHEQKREALEEKITIGGG